MLHPLLQSLRRRVDRLRGRRHVHMMHVGKTGGTAVKDALRRHPPTAVRLHLHRHRIALADVPAGDPFFFFVRDPLHRFASGFYSRQRQGQPRYFAPWSEGERAAFERFATPDALGQALSSPDAEEQHAARQAMGAIQHVRNGYDTWFADDAFFESRRGDLLFVGSQERLEGDFEHLKGLLGLPASATLSDDPTRTHRRPDALQGELSEAAAQNLRAWYEADYRFLDRLAERFDHLPRYR